MLPLKVALDITATHGEQEMGPECDPVGSIQGELGDGEGGVVLSGLFWHRAHNLLKLNDAVDY